MLDLRRAKVGDYWRKAYKREYPFAVESFQLSGGMLEGELNIPIGTGVSAIVGRNGVGKSNVIRALYNSLSSEESNRPYFSTPLFSDSEATLQALHNGVPVTIAVPPKQRNADLQDPLPVSSFMFDPCTLIPSLQKAFEEQSNLEEALEGYEQIALDSDELSLINHLTHGTYEEVLLTNIEDSFAGVGVLPFFKVTTRRTTYDVRTMGLGELSLFYFFWLLRYLSSQSDSKAILFIEEPESFLPPITQERLTNVLAQFVSESAVAATISTHSEHILKNIPRDHIRILMRSNGQLVCLNSVEMYSHIQVLGLSTPKIGMILHEDFIAKQFFRSLWKTATGTSPDCFYYKKSGSKGDIEQDLKRMEPTMEGFITVGVFDGDCRKDRKTLQKTLAGKKFCFLPTEAPPEVPLIEFLGESENDSLAQLFNTTTVQLAQAMEAARGTDHHDYFHELSRELGMELSHVVSIVCDAWVSTEANGDLVQEFKRSFDILR